MLRPGTVALVALLILFTAAGSAVLTESALHVPPVLRVVPGVNAANRLASATKASWTEITVEAQDGARLVAWHFKPPFRNPRGVVMLLHGVSATRAEMLPYARFLIENGFEVLAPDARGHGASGGSSISFGAREVDDLRRWTGWCDRNLPGSPIYAIGTSMGAAILLQALGEGAPVRAAVAEASFRDFRSIANFRIGRSIGVGEPVAQYVFWPLRAGAFAYARSRYGIDLDSVSPLKAMPKIRVPLLLIHGTLDNSIPASHSQALKAAAPESTVLWEIPNGGHCTALGMSGGEYERRVLALFSASESRR